MNGQKNGAGGRSPLVAFRRGDFLVSLGIAVGVHAAVIGVAAWSLVFTGDRGSAILASVFVEELEEPAFEVERSVPVELPHPEIEIPPVEVDPPPDLALDPVDSWSEVVDFGPADESLGSNPFAVPERVAVEPAASSRVRESKRPSAAEASAVSATVVPPRSRWSPPPRYPTAAQRRGVEGVTVIAGTVLEDGMVDRLRVARSSGSSLLDDAAVAAVRKWRFEPARRGGVPIRYPIEVPIEFSLN